MKAIITAPTRADTFEERKAKIVYFHECSEDAKALGYKLHHGDAAEADVCFVYTDIGTNEETRYVEDAAHAAGVRVEYRQLCGREAGRSKRTGVR